MNVLVIPEDFTKDEFVLKPIIQAMMEAIGRSQAKVQVCRAPRLRGVNQALDWERIAEIIDRYRGMTHLFLLCVDRDGNVGRREALNNIESKARSILPPSRGFLGENAWQELEVWVLAGHTLPSDWSWAEVRAEANPKERYFRPFAEQMRLVDAPGEGRKALAKQAAARYSRIRQLCQEDVAALESRIRHWVGASV